MRGKRRLTCDGRSVDVDASTFSLGHMMYRGGLCRSRIGTVLDFENLSNMCRERFEADSVHFGSCNVARNSSRGLSQVFGRL